MIPACEGVGAISLTETCHLVLSCAAEGHVSPSACLWMGYMSVGLGSVNLLGNSHPTHLRLTEMSFPSSFRQWEHQSVHLFGWAVEMY